MKALKISMAALWLFPASVSFAQPQAKDITVQGESLTPARWVATVGEKLSDVVKYPHYFSFEQPENGIVSVGFLADEANRPAALTLVRKSGDPKLDRAALLAISRLGPLPAKPAAFRSGQRFVANLIFATSFDEYDEQVALLRKETTKTQTFPSDNREMAVVVITSHAGAGS